MSNSQKNAISKFMGKHKNTMCFCVVFFVVMFVSRENSINIATNIWPVDVQHFQLQKELILEKLHNFQEHEGLTWADV